MTIVTNTGPTLQAFAETCDEFIIAINLEPNLLPKRLRPKFELNPEFEDLLDSN